MAKVRIAKKMRPLMRPLVHHSVSCELKYTYAMKVRFNLKDKSADTTLIFAILRYNGHRFKYSTQREVKPANWNDKTQRVRQAKESGYFEINSFLKALSSKIIALISEFQAKGENPSPKELKTELDIIYGRSASDDEKSFFGYFAKYIVEKRTDPDDPISEGTAIIFERVLRYLKEFRAKVDFPQINNSFYKGYLRFLYEKKGVGKNTAQYHIKKLKQVLTAADKAGLNRNMAYKDFAVPSAKTFSIYYNESELRQMMGFDFGDKKYLERVRDFFVLASYLGARYGDFLKLDKRNLFKLKDKDGNPFTSCTYAIDKDGKRLVVSVPLHPMAEAIIRKYNGRFPPKISNQKMNEYLKDMARLVGFTNVITVPAQKKGEEPQLIEKCDLTTTHTARRNLITNAKKAGMPDSQIMLLTGHRALSSFKLYDKTSPEDNSAQIATHNFYKPQTLKVAK